MDKVISLDNEILINESPVKNIPTNSMFSLHIYSLVPLSSSTSFTSSSASPLTEFCVFIYQGTCQLKLTTGEHVMKQGDFLVINPQIFQSIKNVGNINLKFYVISTQPNAKNINSSLSFSKPFRF